MQSLKNRRQQFSKMQIIQYIVYTIYVSCAIIWFTRDDSYTRVSVSFLNLLKSNFIAIELHRWIILAVKFTERFFLPVLFNFVQFKATKRSRNRRLDHELILNRPNYLQAVCKTFQKLSPRRLRKTNVQDSKNRASFFFFHKKRRNETKIRKGGRKTDQSAREWEEWRWVRLKDRFANHPNPDDPTVWRSFILSTISHGRVSSQKRRLPRSSAREDVFLGYRFLSISPFFSPLATEEKERGRYNLFERHEDSLPKSGAKNRLLRGWQRSMGVDSSRWITLEIENDALKTSSVHRGFKASTQPAPLILFLSDSRKSAEFFLGFDP